MKIRIARGEHILKQQTLNLFCMLYITTWSLVPVFAHYTSGSLFRILYGAIAFAWIITGVVNIRRRDQGRLAAMIVFLLIMIFYLLLEYGNLAFTDLINYVLLLGYGINAPIILQLPKTILKRLKWYLLICVAFTVTTTLVVLLANPNASRILTSTSASATAGSALELLNVGSYDFIYGIMILVVPLLMTMQKDKRIATIIHLFLCLLIIACIWKANFTTCYILLVLSIALMFIPRTKSVKSVLITVFVVVFFVWIGPSILIYILRLIAENTASIYSSSKLLDIIAIISGEGSISASTSRYDLLMVDINSFLKNPIFGIGAYYGTESYTGIGQHSQILDEIARYGIIGAVPLFYFVIASLRALWERFTNNNEVNCMFIPTVVFLLLSILNPSFNDGVLTCLFIIVPILFACKGGQFDEDTVYN